METDISVDVGSLDATQRRALEQVIGQPLSANQRLFIRVTAEEPPAAASRAVQNVADWTKVYAGLSDAEIEDIDAIAKTRANLTRDLP